jgi:5-methyltetrahydropteroyltriglutamate--homocysteine methyltransferase
VLPTTLLPTTIAGSLPKPAWLAEPQKLWAAWKLSGAELERGKRDAALVVLKEQETAGIDIVSDGEQFRQHFVHGFVAGIEGVDFAKKKRIGIRDNRYEADCPTVVAPLRRPQSIHGEDARFTRAHTRQPLKITIPGPMTIVDTLADEYYKERPRLAMEFAKLINDEARELDAIGVDVIQLDEPAFNVYLEEVEEWGVAAIHRAIEGLRCKTAVHICYGYGIQANIDWKQTLGSEWRQYERIFPALARSKIGQVSLECANSHVPIELLALLKGKEIMVGAIDVADTRVETPEMVAAVIRRAMKVVPPKQILPCTNCGMVPLARDVSYGKLKALAAGAALVRKELGQG